MRKVSSYSNVSNSNIITVTNPNNSVTLMQLDFDLGDVCIHCSPYTVNIPAMLTC